jgi:uncharacterized protein YecE (DUF72 family)
MPDCPQQDPVNSPVVLHPLDALLRGISSPGPSTRQVSFNNLIQHGSFERQMGRVRVGISGWTYAPWRGVFYPDRLPHARELAYAAEHFSTVEINGTFYSLQRPSSFARWSDATPEDFVFSVKGSRFITHMLRLRNVEQALANFFASGILLLKPKLGPILWQFPPTFSFNASLLEDFFRLLPRTTMEAALLGRSHDGRLDGHAHTETDKDRPLRHAIEIRHDSFLSEEFIRLLRRYRIALVCADTVSWPRPVDATTDFVYCRLHGSRELYVSGYGAKAIATWADRIAAWASGTPPKGTRVSAFSPMEARPHDVYVYFDNDMKVRAPADALSLERRLAKLGIAEGFVKSGRVGDEGPSRPPHRRSL